jgi:tetratricopeptide (TPR) repeat protein
LTAEGRLLDQLAVDGSTLMRDVIDDSYRHLPESARQMYRALGALPLAAFTPASAAAAAALSVRQARELLDRLAEANLIYERGQESFGFYPLIAAHARDIVREPLHVREARDANSRTIAWYLGSAINAAGKIRPYRRDIPDLPEHPEVEPLAFAGLADALDWLDREDDNILTLARTADHDTALAMIGQLWALFAYRKKYPIWEEADTLGLYCARATDNRDQEARMLRRLGLLTRDLGRYPEAEAYLTAAAEIFQDLGDQHRAATARGTLGVVQLRQGRSAQAAETLTRVLEAHRESGEQREVALVLIDLADTHIELGQPDAAIENLREAADHFDTSPDEGTRARLTLLLGRAHTHTGRHQAAEQELADALTSARHNGSTTRQIEALMYQGELAARTGRPDLARSLLAEAGALRETAGIPRAGWLPTKISALALQVEAGH